MGGLRFRPMKEVEAPPGGAEVRLPFSEVERLSRFAQTPPPESALYNPAHMGQEGRLVQP